MSVQGSLFPSQDRFQPDPEREEPVVWVRELVILHDWQPGGEVRRITLRPGLNILWARPREFTQPPRLREAGVFGHASGKTTFCRLLRYVMGEPHFSNEDMRDRIRSKFRGGWVVGEIIVASEPWLVCRPLAVGPHPFSIRGRRLAQLFDDGVERRSLDEFREALDQATVHPLPVQTFATREDPLRWAHLLEWLTRDQECRYAGLTDFRHPTSESGAPDIDTEDKHFLLRAVLRLIDVHEQSELEDNKRLLRLKQNAEKRAPLLKYQAEVALKRLNGELIEMQALSDELFLDAVPRVLNAKIESISKSIEGMQETPHLRTARQAFIDRQGERQAADKRVEGWRTRIQGAEIELKVLRGEALPSDTEKWLAEIVAKQKLCTEPLSKAIEWECPLVTGRPLPIEQRREEIPIAARIAIAERRLNALHLELKSEELQVIGYVRNEREAQVFLSNVQKEHDDVRAKLSDERSRYRAQVTQAEQAKKDGNEAQQLTDSLEVLDKQIRKSQERQARLREMQSVERGMVSETFERVMKAVLGAEVGASIDFHGRQIRTKVVHRGDLTSAAIETIKIIGFDLAALISSVEGRGDHPRFLLHDGPREADMAADLYQKIFLVARELEESFAGKPPSFQYIITTTEPPPEILNRSPWRLEPVLSSGEPEGRLLRTDL